MVNIFCFVVLLGCLIGGAEPTAFVFNGTLFCHQPTWQYHIKVYELDSGMDDLLGQHKQIVTGKNSSSYLIDGTYESWDGLFDWHYEIGYSIDFICTGAATSFDIRSLTIPDTQRYFREELEFDLTNNRWRVFRRCNKLFCDFLH